MNTGACRELEWKETAGRRILAAVEISASGSSSAFISIVIPSRKSSASVSICWCLRRCPAADSLRSFSALWNSSWLVVRYPAFANEEVFLVSLCTIYRVLIANFIKGPPNSSCVPPLDGLDETSMAVDTSMASVGPPVTDWPQYTYKSLSTDIREKVKTFVPLEVQPIHAWEKVIQLRRDLFFPK